MAIDVLNMAKRELEETTMESEAKLHMDNRGTTWCITPLFSYRIASDSAVLTV